MIRNTLNDFLAMPLRGTSALVRASRGLRSFLADPRLISCGVPSGQNRKQRIASFIAAPALALAFLACFAGNLSAAETPNFAKHIAPLFQQYCLDCHGKQDPEGALVLEDYVALMKGGDTGPAILPGKSAESLLVKFLEGRSGKEGKNQFMPPGKKKHLEPSEIALIRSWIDAGAKPSASGSALTLNIPKIAPKVAPAKSVSALAY